MERTKLLEALRYCGERSNEIGCTECTVGFGGDCIEKLMRDAANEIKELQAENDALRAENETYHKLVLLSVEEISELRYKLHLDEMDVEEIKLP